MTDLFDDLAAAVERRPYIGPKTCTAGFALARLDEAKRAKATALVDDPLVDPARIAQALTTESGVQVDTVNIRRHRNRLRAGMTSCKCPW